jgi:hypothetical protein
VTPGTDAFSDVVSSITTPPRLAQIIILSGAGLYVPEEVYHCSDLRREV